ncbi:MAG TPA: cache domain-containing protein, partial [Patescibacteria group bacterium]|nr:cache domain-containing protein [Patescibacteria group bacterium]
MPSTFTPSKRLKLLNPELTVRSFIFPSQHARTPHALTSGYNFNYHNISKSNYPALMFFKSLKNEILLFTLGLTILTIIITAALGAFSTQTAGRDAEKATSDTLQSQTKESLIQIAESTAKQQDILFEQLKSDTANLAIYTKDIYDNPSVFNNSTYWRFDDRVFKKDGLYLNSQDDISTFHIPNFVVLDAKEKRSIELTANLDFIVPSLLKSNPYIAAIYTIDNKGVTRYYPNIVLGSLAPPDYDPRPDIYYKPATPEENPGKKVVWSPLYEDRAGLGLMITATAPVYTKDGFQGIAGVDIFLKDIIKIISEYKPIEGSYAFLIDKEGNTIAFTDKAYHDILGRPHKEGEVQTNLIKENTSKEFSNILKEMTSGTKGFGSIHSGTKELFIGYAPLNQTGFSLAIVAEKDVLLKAVAALHSEISDSIQYTIQRRILPVSFFIIILESIVSIFLITRIVNPIQRLTKGANEIGNGNWGYNLEIKSKNEIGSLADAFKKMVGQLLQREDYLKKQKEERETLLQSLTDGVIAVDPQDRIILFNKEAERITGLTGNSVLNKNIDEVLQVYDQDQRMNFNQYRAQAKDFVDKLKTIGIYIVDKSGEKIRNTIITTPVTFENQTQNGWIITMHDLRKEQELDDMKLDFITMAA